MNKACDINLTSNKPTRAKKDITYYSNHWNMTNGINKAYTHICSSATYTHKNMTKYLMLLQQTWNKQYFWYYHWMKWLVAGKDSKIHKSGYSM